MCKGRFKVIFPAWYLLFKVGKKINTFNTFMNFKRFGGEFPSFKFSLSLTRASLHKMHINLYHLSFVILKPQLEQFVGS